MYEAFFQLKQRPFAAAPQPERYFPAQSVEAAYHALARCVDRAEGPGILIGGAGTGKSLLLEMLARRFADRFSVAMLSSGSFSSRRELLQAILYELQLPYRGLDEGEMRLALFEHLNPNPDCPAGVLLLVDEAQRLAMRLLEERLAHVTTPMSLSIIGCVVNGPGEALFTDVGFTGGGKGAGMVYLAGRQDHKLDNVGMVDHIVQLVEARAAVIEAERDQALQAAE